MFIKCQYDLQKEANFRFVIRLRNKKEGGNGKEIEVVVEQCINHYSGTKASM